MKGSRLNTIEISKLYKDFIAYINGRRKEPIRKAYKTKSKGIQYQFIYDDTQKWCNDFDTFISNENDFNNLINDIADNQAKTIYNLFSKFEREVYVPCIGRFTIKDAIYNILKNHNFNIKEVLSLTRNDFMKEKKEFYDDLRTNRFNELNDKLKINENRTERLANILRRGKA